ncbi:MAG: hypothetical protein AAGG51_04065 [Cyanobacteria bacterium P01_G01_bin.54]
MPKLQDRWSASFQTGTELGESSAFGEVSAFIPLSRVPGESTVFLEGQMRLFTYDAAYGGNARIGDRQFDAASDWVWSGYVGLDQHRTEFRNTFWQLGLGAEVLAQDWEAWFNAYLPLGDARQEIVPLRRGEFSGYQLGGNDLDLTVFTGSTVSFVDFANVGANNTGFDDISRSPTSTPSSCP